MTVSIARARGGAGLVTALAFGSLGNGLFLPLSLVYFTELTDIPLPLLGVIITSSVLITIPIPVIAGRLVDRFGAKLFVVAALAAQSICMHGDSPEAVQMAAQVRRSLEAAGVAITPFLSA